jgi:hypothetical protein
MSNIDKARASAALEKQDNQTKWFEDQMGSKAKGFSIVFRGDNFTIVSQDFESLQAKFEGKVFKYQVFLQKEGQLIHSSEVYETVEEALMAGLVLSKGFDFHVVNFLIQGLNAYK